MIQIDLNNRPYNMTKLMSELEAYQGVYTYSENESTQLFIPETMDSNDIQAIRAIIENHDVSLTASQENEQARQTVTEGALRFKKSWKLIQIFNKEPETYITTFLEQGGVPTMLDRQDILNQIYLKWRKLFESLPDNIKVRIMFHGYMLSHSYEFYPEPDSPSAEYKAWFNNACAQVMGYIIDRAQM